MKEYLENTNHFVMITTSMSNGIKISFVAAYSKVYRVKNQSAKSNQKIEFNNRTIIGLCYIYIHCIVCFLEFYLIAH